jgi:UDP-N-acetylglucosamine--N-acetylmuramyl-(pentapeptide) pyrophosphoryl-undecaprenol N-acetylglucosamine transferase
VAETLRASGAQTLLVLSRKAVDRQGARVAPTIEVDFIPAIGAPSGISARWISFGAAFAASVVASLRIFRRFRADVVMGMGGFTSAPPILAANLLGVPSLIHESNAVPGKANRFTSRWASAIAVGMAGCARFFPPAKTYITGTPVRGGLRRLNPEEARAQLGLQRGWTTVLVMGGSQGARVINQSVADSLALLKCDRARLQFIHLCGAGNAPDLRAAYARQNVAARVEEFFRDMDIAYSAADVVVSRAGASTLAEIAHYGLPSVLVPYAQAADQHQLRNAEAFADSGAAQILLEDRLNGETLASVLNEVLTNETLRDSMRGASSRKACCDANQQIVSLLYRMAGVQNADIPLPSATPQRRPTPNSELTGTV